jgi:hypothetical protein
MSVFNDPNHWRERAAELRELARETDDAEERVLLLRMATEYDRLAIQAATRTQKQ